MNEELKEFFKKYNAMMKQCFEEMSKTNKFNSREYI